MPFRALRPRAVGCYAPDMSCTGHWTRLLVAAALCAGCAQGGGNGGRMDAGVLPDASGPRDSGRRDAYVAPRDAWVPPPTDAGGGTDAWVPPPMDAGGTPDTGPPDSGPRDTGLPACPIGAGSLAIVEVMISSRSGGGDRGEWFEVLNEESCTISLPGLQIVSPTSGGTEKVHTVTMGAIAPGAHHVFALSAAPGDNHGLAFDYAYGVGGSDDVILNNGADWLELRSGGTAVDRVTWPSGGFTHSYAREFPTGRATSTNDTWAFWCDATGVYSTMGGTFYGTPGAANSTSCP